MNLLSQLQLTQQEEETILHFLRQARDCGYPSCNETYYPVIDGIFTKYYNKVIDVEAEQLGAWWEN